MRITFISDTHTKHRSLNLPGGDVLIHAGDLMNSGYNVQEIDDFCNWFETQDYVNCIFIAGNHDRMFEDSPNMVNDILNKYPGIDYLQDYLLQVGEDWEDYKFSVYGSPWQPEFYNWAFNLPRAGEELEEKWAKIPDNVDILITHGPPQDHLDVSGPPWNTPHLGCELLRVRVNGIKPKIHVFGHIHGSHGYKFHDGTHFINASILNERYEVVNNGLTIEWDEESNDISFI